MIPFLLVWYYSYLRYPQFYIAAFMITLSVQANHTIMKPNHIHVTPLSFILPSSQVHQKYTCTSQAHALRRYTTTPLPPLHNTATPLRQLSTHPPTTSCTQRKTEKSLPSHGTPHHPRSLEKCSSLTALFHSRHRQEYSSTQLRGSRAVSGLKGREPCQYHPALPVGDLASR
jgi:hypothetical protein